MKKRALRKEFFMEIRKSLPRFLSILFIVALGTAFYSGIQSSSPDIRYSGESYFDEDKLLDLQVSGTMGLTEKDVEALQSLPEIEKAEPSYLKDVLTERNGQRKVLRILSMPQKLNLVTVEEGQFPDQEGECLLDIQYANQNGYRLGDTFQISEELKKDEDAALKTDTFTISGFCSSPLYISFSRGSTNVGNGEIAGFVYVPEETFAADCYMQIYLEVKGAEALTAYTDDYENIIEKAKTQVESIEQERCDARYDEIKEEAQEKVTDARAELSDKKKEAEQKLADARKELDDARKKLEDGRQELADKEKELADGKKALADKEKELADAQSQIQDGEKKLKEAEETLSKKESEFQKQKKAAQKKIAQGEKELAEGQKTLKKNKKAFEQQRAEFEQQKQSYLSSLAQYEQNLAEYEQNKKQGIPESVLAPAKAQLDAAKVQLDAARAQISAGEQQIFQAEAQLSSAEDKLNENLDKLAQSKQKLESGEAKLKKARKELTAQKKKLNDSKAQITDGERQISDAKKELADGEVKIADAKKTIEKNEKKLAKGERKYEKAKTKADKKIAKAEKKIDDAQKTVDDLKKPEWTVGDRSDVLEYTNYGDNAIRMKNIGEVFPVIFFLVAALISLTTMTRMVEEERTQIGTMKALGYSKADIAAKYLLYALFATMGGSIFGILIGEKILPYIIIRAYGIMYLHMNTIRIPYNMKFALIASGAAVFCTMIATLEACIRELRAWPAVLMRPPAPKQGKRVWIEKIPFLWKHLSFTWKSTVRNLFRYKKRFFMTIIGIGGCMGLLLVGFGLRDSIMDVAILQYQDIQIYDGMVILDEDADQEEQDKLQQELADDDSVEAFAEVSMKKVEFASGNSRLDVYLMVVPDDVPIDEFVKFRSRTTKEAYELDEQGMLLTEKAGKLLGVSAEDSLEMTGENRGVAIPVSHICENYMSHFAYMTDGMYRRLYGTAPEYNSILYRVAERDEKVAEKAGERAMQMDAALSVTYTGNTKNQLDNMLTALDSVIVVLILSAGMLAFVVLYNLNNININERKRELATIKVLGFYDREVAAYVYRENILLTILGSIFGAFLGMLLHRFIIVTVEVDLCMFGRNISLLSYAVSALITCGFSILVNGVMYFKLKKIDMVESLKSVE